MELRMNTSEIIEELIRKSSWNGKDNWDQNALKRFLIELLENQFELIYDELPESPTANYWNEDQKKNCKRIDLPEAYLEFLFRSQRQTIQLGGAYGMGIWGWPDMLTSTIDYMECSDDETAELILWISIAERGDKGYIFLCCDTKSPLYGLVVEFYDGTPWSCDLPTFPDSDIYGTFEEFMVMTIGEFGKATS